MDPNVLRSHNPYLPALASVAPEIRPNVDAILELVPVLASSLMEFARYYGGVLANKYNPRTSDHNAHYVVLCIFDVQLNQLFGYFQQAVPDDAAAASLVGAVLYQALGKTPHCDDQTIFLGMSYKLRGREKYAASARIFPGSEEPVSATFGREFAQLIYGRTTDDVMMLGSSKLLIIGLYTDANIRGIMFSEEFSDADRARVEAMGAEHDQKTNRLIQELRRRSPASGL